jgi:hypothetical protein
MVGKNYRKGKCCGSCEHAYFSVNWDCDVLTCVLVKAKVLTKRWYVIIGNQRYDFFMCGVVLWFKALTVCHL